MEERKRIEQRRYDDQASPLLGGELPRDFGAAGVSPELRAPYTQFEQHVLSLVSPNAVVVDIGAGTGAFSLSARGAGRLLIATDISGVALRIAQRRASEAGVQLCLVCADAERLPFRDAAVDLVTSAGALYCFDLRALTAEVRRILRADGAWVIVDSLNENPLYRLNRWIGFLRHRRTALAVRNVPTTSTLRQLAGAFRTVDISYHGVLAFLLPLLKPVVGAAQAGAYVHAADRWMGGLRRWAFKVVVVARGRLQHTVPPPTLAED